MCKICSLRQQEKHKGSLQLKGPVSHSRNSFCCQHHRSPVKTEQHGPYLSFTSHTHTHTARSAARGPNTTTGPHIKHLLPSRHTGELDPEPGYKLCPLMLPLCLRHSTTDRFVKCIFIIKQTTKKLDNVRFQHLSYNQLIQLDFSDMSVISDFIMISLTFMPAVFLQQTKTSLHMKSWSTSFSIKAVKYTTCLLVKLPIIRQTGSAGRKQLLKAEANFNMPRYYASVHPPQPSVIKTHLISSPQQKRTAADGHESCSGRNFEPKVENVGGGYWIHTAPVSCL